MPTREEENETWMEQTMQALEEWDVPEVQTKQCITESLSGTATEILSSVKRLMTTLPCYKRNLD